MRILVAAVLAVALASPAVSEEGKTPLPPGKPAGVKAADLDVTDTVIIATTAAILITAVILGVTQKGYSPAPATDTGASP